MKKKLERLGLSFLFTLIVFIIFAITGMLMITFGYLLMSIEGTDRLGFRRSIPVLMVSFPASAIVGSLVAFIFGRIPLKPVREIIDATNKLAAGDFSARITFPHNSVFRELRDSFNRMAQELSSIEVLRSDFVNNFSHEFKTPIVSIKGFAELLKMDALTLEERNEYLDIIVRESSRLATMATNVLNLSRVENQTIVTERKKYNLSEQIRRCILLMQTSWEQKQLDLDIDLQEVSLYGNEEMLSQVWVNLLDNAVKFSDIGGKIAVELRRTGEKAEVVVRDYGRGVSSEDLAHIFDKFYQGNSAHIMQGNGLGLTLARRIVQLHGGTIDCTSEPDHWTEFMVQLPLSSGDKERLSEENHKKV